MEYNYKKNGNKEILIIFLGWSCDKNSTTPITFDVYDILYIYDYTHMELDIEQILSKYLKIHLIGWSFGVWAAEQWAKDRTDIDCSIAINGTAMPVNSEFGIPPKIFNFTLRNIKNKGIELFYEKMCGEDIAVSVRSERDFEQQYEELKILGERGINSLESDFCWKYSIIGTKDLIFPVANMINYWNKKSKFAPIIMDIPHFPFGQRGMSEINNILTNDTIR